MWTINCFSFSTQLNTRVFFFLLSSLSQSSFMVNLLQYSHISEKFAHEVIMTIQEKTKGERNRTSSARKCYKKELILILPPSLPKPRTQPCNKNNVANFKIMKWSLTHVQWLYANMIFEIYLLILWTILSVFRWNL